MITQTQLKYIQMPANIDWEQHSCRTTGHLHLLPRPSQTLKQDMQILNTNAYQSFLD